MQAFEAELTGNQRTLPRVSAPPPAPEASSPGPRSVERRNSELAWWLSFPAGTIDRPGEGPDRRRSTGSWRACPRGVSVGLDRIEVRFRQREKGGGAALRAGPGAREALVDGGGEVGDRGRGVEALVPSAVEPAVTDRGAAGLPQVAVDAGPDPAARFLSSSRGGSRTSRHVPRTGGRWGAVSWHGARRPDLRSVSPLHVAAYIRIHPASVPTVKQHLAAIRMLGD